MKDILSRVLGTLAILVGIATLVALYIVWTVVADNKAAFTDMLNGYDDRIAALEQKGTMEEEGEGAMMDERPLMPENYFGTLPPNLDPATTEEDYRNSDIGLVMKIPYNPDWGNRLYRVAPYEEQHYPMDEDGRRAFYWMIQFGPSSVFEGGGWARAYTLVTSKARSADDEITYLKETNDGFLKEDSIETVEVNGKTVVVYYTGGLCNLVNLVVVGESVNYQLTPLCGDTDQIRETLLNVVRTMEFVEYESLI